MQTPLKIDRDLLSAQDVADRLSVAVRTLWRMVERGDFPPPIRFNRKLVRWRARDLVAYVQHLEVRPAS
jgi:predicted DNA-binding transcriptional regulator AlpA